MKTKRKILSFLMTVAMVVSIITTFVVTASAVSTELNGAKSVGIDSLGERYKLTSLILI